MGEPLSPEEMAFGREKLARTKAGIADTKFICTTMLHDLFKQYDRAHRAGYERDNNPLHTPVWDGRVYTITLVKYNPVVEKPVKPEVAEIQAKFPDQEGAAAKEFIEPSKRGRKPKDVT